MITVEELLTTVGFIIQPKRKGRYNRQEGRYVYEDIPNTKVIKGNMLNTDEKVLSNKFDKPPVHYIYSGCNVLFAVAMPGKLGFFYGTSVGTNIKSWRIFADIKRIDKVDHYNDLCNFLRETEKYVEETTEEFNIKSLMMRLEK